jgi:excisionase family DNA binding protein
MMSSNIWKQGRKIPGDMLPPSGWYKTYRNPDENLLMMTPENIRKISAHYLKKLSKYPDVLSVNQLSSLTGYSTTTLLKWINRGAIKHLDMGNRYLVPKEWLLEFLSGPELMKARIPSKYGKEQIAKIFGNKR